jgi:hypothetical protein
MKKWIKTSPRWETMQWFYAGALMIATASLLATAPSYWSLVDSFMCGFCVSAISHIARLINAERNIRDMRVWGYKMVDRYNKAVDDNTALMIEVERHK